MPDVCVQAPPPGHVAIVVVGMPLELPVIVIVECVHDDVPGQTVTTTVVSGVVAVPVRLPIEVVGELGMGLETPVGDEVPGELEEGVEATVG